MSFLNGLIGLVIFVLDVIAIASIIGYDASNREKTVWVVVVMVLPFVGLVIWWLAGPKSGRSAGI